MQIKFEYIPSITTAVTYLTIWILFMGITTNDNYNKVMAQAQEPIFELPVQLVGFPVIILAVRFSNFVKKLSYSLSPQTYQSRMRRSSPPEIHLINSDNDRLHGFELSRQAVDISIAEKQILNELGPKACVIEEPCRLHAARTDKSGEQPDWNDILQNYKVQSSGMKQWYLLSVFLGDMIRDVSLCKQLAKRLTCGRRTKPIIRD